MRPWLGRTEALKLLRVRPQTLYAYVSRGQISAKPDPDEPRRSLYRAADIHGLTERRARGKRPAAIASSTIAWGEPIITTSISTVIGGRLIYRGRDAAELAEHASLEEVAQLLWNASEKPGFISQRSVEPNDDPFTALSALVGTALPSIGRTAARLHADAAVATGTLTEAFGIRSESAPLHQRIRKAWSLDARGADFVRRALVLLADHELNASTFAVRVASSTGASIAASLLAGLAALTGPRHGGAAEALLGVLQEAEGSDAATAIRMSLTRHRHIPGFGHPLYPEGDPRATALLKYIKLGKFMDRVQRVAEDMTGSLPNIDFALAAFTRSYHLPKETPFRLFAIGRSVGWSAHAIEQAAIGRLIRPRARYNGELQKS